MLVIVTEFAADGRPLSQGEVELRDTPVTAAQVQHLRLGLEVTVFTGRRRLDYRASTARRLGSRSALTLIANHMRCLPLDYARRDKRWWVIARRRATMTYLVECFDFNSNHIDILRFTDEELGWSFKTAHRWALINGETVRIQGALGTADFRVIGIE